MDLDRTLTKLDNLLEDTKKRNNNIMFNHRNFCSLREVLIYMNQFKEAILIGSVSVGVPNIHSDLDYIIMDKDVGELLESIDHTVYDLFPKPNNRFGHLLKRNNSSVLISNTATSYKLGKNDHLLKIEVSVLKKYSTVIDLLIYTDKDKFEAAKFANESSIIYNQINKDALVYKLERIKVFNEFYQEFLDDRNNHGLDHSNDPLCPF